MNRRIATIMIIAFLAFLLLAIFWFIAPEVQIMVSERFSATPQVLTASDKLNFTGVMLGTIITIIALCITILFTQEQQRETLRLSKLPYVVSDMQVLYTYDKVKQACYVLPHRYYFLIPDYGYCVSRNYSDDVLNYNLLEEINKSERAFFDHHLVFDYQLTNSGAGNAVSYKLTMNTMELSKVTDAIAVNQSTNYLIVVHDSYLKLSDNPEFSRLPLKFRISYMDESSVGCYNQFETICVEKNNDLACIYTIQEENESLSNAKRVKSRMH